MTKVTSPPISHSIDRALVARIVNEVLARLVNGQPTVGQNEISSPHTKTTSKTEMTAVSIGDRVVSLATIEQIQGAPKQLFLSHGAVVTPAASDEANRRGMALNRTVEIASAQQPHRIPVSNCNPSRSIEVSDCNHPERAETIVRQLAKRGINRLQGAIVLSDTPATDVHHACAVKAERAVMITSLADVDRFASELSPTVWVLDMAKINLVAAVNIVARIAQRTE